MSFVFPEIGLSLEDTESLNNAEVKFVSKAYYICEDVDSISRWIPEPLSIIFF